MVGSRESSGQLERLVAYLRSRTIQGAGKGCGTLRGLARGAHPQAPLRYDGIYQSQAEEWTPWGTGRVQVWSYLRFTPDGMVINFVTTGEPDQLGNFSLANTILPIASVTVRDGRIAFTVSECGGVQVDYEGHADGDRLYLHVHSHYNGYQADQVFAFVPISAERRRQWDTATGWVPRPCPPDSQGP